MAIARRLLNVTLILLSGVALLVVAALLALQTDWGRDQVRVLAERQASSALGAQVSIGRLEGSLFYGATLNRLAVTDDGREIASANRVSASYDIFDLLRGSFALDEIVLDGPVIHAQALSLLGRDEPTDPEAPRQVFSIGRIVITNGRVVVGKGPAEIGGIEIPDLLRDVEADFSVAIGPRDMQIAVKHLAFVGERPDVSLRQLAGTVTLEDDNLVLEDISVELAESSMRLSGTIENVRSFGGANASNDEVGSRSAVAPADRHP